MKTMVLLLFSTLCRSPKKRFLTLLLTLRILPGANTTQAATADAVGVWGDNRYGQTTAPVAVQRGVTAIAAGGRHTVALKNDGTVVAWGWNEFGAVTGTPTIAEPYSATATPVTLGGQVLSGVIAIAAGADHTVDLKNDGTVVAWGLNGAGQVTGTPTIAGPWPYSATATPVTLGGQVLSGVIAIAAGNSHTVALKKDGTVVAWGSNYSGQVTGTPTVNDPHSATATPVILGDQVLTGVIAITAGGAHTVALKNDGTVVAWGYNGDGQVTGTPTIATVGALRSATATPVTLGGQVLSGVRAIAAGGSHTVALKNDGTVVAWGNNYSGEVTGNPTIAEPYSATATPVTLGGQVLTDVVAISAGENHTIALKNDGSVVAWGENFSGKVTAPPTIAKPPYFATATPVTVNGQVLRGVTAIAAGGSHTVVLVIPIAPTMTASPVDLTVNVGQTVSFTVSATGFPLNYQWRKDGVNLAAATSSTYNVPFALTNRMGSYSVAVSNAAGSVTSAPPAMLTVNPTGLGTAVLWGWNKRFDGWNAIGMLEAPVAAQSGVTAIAAGGCGDAAFCEQYTVALKNDGTVVQWGGYFSAGGRSFPTGPVAAQSGLTAIAAGGSHALGLKEDGTVIAWGGNFSGQVTGTPTTDEPYSTTANPVTLGGQVLTGVTAIAAGDGHTVALKNDGTVIAWGDNLSGQVTGTPTIANEGALRSATATPVTLGGQILSRVTAIAAGHSHTVALKSDGTVVAWGGNSSGQVTGTPTFDEPWSATAAPVTFGGQVLSGVVAIAAGGRHTVALKNDGTVVAWGSHADADDENSTVAAPVRLGGKVLSGVTAIAAGDAHIVALKNDGTIAAWGENRYGQVSDTPNIRDDFESNFAIASPVTLGDQVLTGVTAIAAGPNHTVALLGIGLPMLSLTSRLRGNELILSWPAAAVGFTLQSTLNLTPPVAWIDYTKSPEVIGTQLTIRTPITGTAQFYRLRKP